MAFFQSYRPHRFNSSTRETVDRANGIIDDMRSQGYTLSVRQLFYQFVSKGWLPNTDKEYKRLGRLVTHAREAGLMDWRAIEDRGRTAYGTPTEEDPAEVVHGIEQGLRLDQWARQDNYIEVWVEKQALESIISRACNKADVTYMACKGYLSASASWLAGRRFQNALFDGKKPVLIHLADHDPSGLNMTEDNTDRLRMFAEDQNIEVRRIALNMDQVEQYNPPPNPAKESDSRAQEYVRRFGSSSWELDALEPSVLEALITSTIDEYRDPNLWASTLEEQAEIRRPLEALSDNWLEVKEIMDREGMI